MSERSETIKKAIAEAVRQMNISAKISKKRYKSMPAHGKRLQKWSL